MSERYKVVYEFESVDSSELSIKPGEILTIINKSIGGGWWEGRNSQGHTGLLPESYVEPYVEPDINSAPPVPPPPPHYRTEPASNRTSTFLTSSEQNIQFRNPQTGATQSGTVEEPDWPDDEWDDDDDSGDNATEYSAQSVRKGYATGTPYYGAMGSQPVQPGLVGGASQDQTPAMSNLSLSDSRGQVAQQKTKKNFTKLNLSKPVLEMYILDPSSINVPLENIIHIQSDQEQGIMWKPNLNPYTCSVTIHGKESKMKGLKTYISYDITPSTSNIVVRRRYKHFDWLMQRLDQKFSMIPLPSLPEKQISGRFQEDFVEHRRNLLQLWINYMTRHPVLSQCDVWWHFMTCNTDDMKGWKLGKRKAEKDDLVGPNFLFSIQIDPNTPPLDPVKTSKQLDNFQRFVAKLDDAVKHMFFAAIDQGKKISTVYSKDYKKLSESIKDLAFAFQSGTHWRNSLALNEAIRQTSCAYEDVSKLHEEGPKADFEPMADVLHQYRGLLSGWPDILSVHKSSNNIRMDQERLFEERKISQNDLARINQRTNAVTYATLAEINHFHTERLVDFKQMMQSFLIAQINFHSDILGKLQAALTKINDA